MLLFSGVFDSEAGLVDAAMANSVHQQLAEARGVKIITKTKVVKLEKVSAGMKVDNITVGFTLKITRLMEMTSAFAVDKSSA